MADVKQRMLAKLAAIKEAQRAKPCSNSKAKRSKQFKNLNTKKFDFEVDDLDHCETEARAYDDIVEILGLLASSMQKQPNELKIYDPYYCDGAVIRNLKDRGFPSVYNRNEDFYKVQAQNRIPDYDVLVTNPPYSADHMQRMLEFCVKMQKPWLALMPNYVYTKDYFNETLGTVRPFYITPVDRYVYWSPGGTRQSSRERKTSPFASFWYVHLGERTAEVIKQLRKCLGIRRGTSGLNPGDLCLPVEESRQSKHSVSFGATNQGTPRLGIFLKAVDLPDRYKAMFDKTRRRLRKKQRIAIKKRRKESGSK